MVLSTIMQIFGVELDIVDDGRRRSRPGDGGDYDLILMDIQMPVMDGIDAAREIRAARSGRAAGRARRSSP